MLVSGFNLNLILPEIILGALGLILLFMEAFIPKRIEGRRHVITLVSLIGVGLAMASLWLVPLAGPGLGGMVTGDRFGIYFRAILLAIMIMVSFTSEEYVRRKGIATGEFYALLAFATTGAMFMVISIDIISLYIGLELLSLSSYILAGLLRADARSGEASLKFFLNGALSSAVFIFGISFFFAMAGSTSLMDMADAIIGGSLEPLGVAGLILVLAGLGFKLGAVPFHLWVPDTYQGAPTPVTAFLSVGSKGAALAALLRIFFTAFAPLQDTWMVMLAIVSVITMTAGNVAGLHQKNVKRMLGYSSVAQVGYILAGLAAGSQLGFSAAMFYIVAYAFMNIGAFAVLITLANQGEGEEVADLAGLARREPVLAFLMLVFVLSLLGIPPLAGFWAKLFVIRAAVAGGVVWLAIALALNSAISVGYYWKIAKSMYVTPVTENARGDLTAGITLQIGLALAAAGVLVLGIFPEAFLGWATVATLIP